MRNMKPMMSVAWVATAMALVASCSRRHIADNPPPPVIPRVIVDPPPPPAPQQYKAQTNSGNTVVSTQAQPPRSTAMSEATRRTLKEELAKLEDALFDYDQTNIRADARTALADDVGIVRGILSDFPAQKLMIEGHADERGSAEYNLAL